MTISETIDSFTPDKQEALKTSLRNEMGCHEPDCNLALQIAGGSISVVSILTIPDTPPSGIDSATLVASVEIAATQLVAQPLGTFAASLGVSVESTASIAVQTGLIVPLLVAPPPPAPPPALPLAEAQTTESDGLSIGLLVGAIGGGVGALVVAVLVCLVCMWRCKSSDDAKEAYGIVYRGSVAPPPPPDAFMQASQSAGIELEALDGEDVVDGKYDGVDIRHLGIDINI